MPAVSVFVSAMTQWNFASVGPVGLRYEALPLLMECEGIAREDWPATLADVRTMEAHALELLSKARKR